MIEVDLAPIRERMRAGLDACIFLTADELAGGTASSADLARELQLRAIELVGALVVLRDWRKSQNG